MLEAKYENPLPVLAEIRFYHHSKLLSDKDTLDAYARLLGDEEKARTLMEGSEVDRTKTLEKWLPKD
jgi:hypothetical protein